MPACTVTQVERAPSVKAIDIFFKQFKDAGYFPKDPNAVTYEDANALFYAGKAAMIPTGHVARVGDHGQHEGHSMSGSSRSLPSTATRSRRPPGSAAARSSPPTRSIRTKPWSSSTGRSPMRSSRSGPAGVQPDPGAARRHDGRRGVAALPDRPRRSRASPAGPASEFGYNIDVLTPAGFNEQMFTGLPGGPQREADAAGAGGQAAGRVREGHGRRRDDPQALTAQARGRTNVSGLARPRGADGGTPESVLRRGGRRRRTPWPLVGPVRPPVRRDLRAVHGLAVLRHAPAEPAGVGRLRTETRRSWGSATTSPSPTTARSGTAVSHILIWAVVGTIAPIAIGLPLAILLWSGTRFRLAFRAIYFIPVILPVVVIGLVWGWIYNPLFGVLNSILEAVGLGDWTTGLARRRGYRAVRRPRSPQSGRRSGSAS